MPQWSAEQTHDAQHNFGESSFFVIDGQIIDIGALDGRTIFILDRAQGRSFCSSEENSGRTVATRLQRSLLITSGFQEHFAGRWEVNLLLLLL